MNEDSANTIVMQDVAPPPRPVKRAALARLAFGSVPSSVAAHSLGPRHLAFLPPESLELDLSDPAQCQFGDYELVSKLGQGGMGVVYRARQRSLDRDVALKLLSAGPWASRDFIERFRREAQSAARMQHPNIVAIYEIGSHDELNFFSMRLVDGVSLAHQLQESGPLPPKRAAQLMRTVAEALDYAHRLGVLHLDLKPANVLIDERGEPQVADFGLARRLDETLTRDNDEVSGTPSYMAPEQAQIRSHKLSQATDIYGLGAILYELLTGRPPFLGPTPQDTLQRVITESPTSPRHLQPQVPVDLEAICLKCLAKEPSERYLSARALADDLARFVDGRPVSVRPLNTFQRAARWARREPHLAAAVGAAAIALVVGLAATTTQWRRADANASDARHTLWLMRSQAAQASLAEGDGFRGLKPLLQNLGEMDAEGRIGEAAVERQRIGTVLANAPQLIDLFHFPQGTVVSSVAIAPDGKRFALATHAGNGKRMVRQYDLDGHELWAASTDNLTHLLPWADGSPHGSLHYTPDGKRLVVLLQQQPVIPAPTVSDAIALEAADGRVLMPPKELGHVDIVYSEDARRALVRFRSDSSLRFPDSGQLFDPETWQALGPRLPHGEKAGADEWLFTPDGRHLLGSSDFTHFTLFEPATLAPERRFEVPARELVRSWRFSPDGRLLALGTNTGGVYLFDVREDTREALPSAPVATVRWLQFSADGGTLVAQAENNAIAAWDVATRRPRSAPISAPGRNWLSRVLPVGDALYSVSGEQLRMWTLAPLAPFDNFAVPGAARLRSARDFFEFGFDVHAPSRLMIAGAGDGSVGLWRLPPPPVLEFRAAPLPASGLGFDGEHVVAVEGHEAQLRDVRTGAARSRAFVHPENVRFAELSHDGKALVTVAGRTVRVLDLASGAVRGAPIVLPQTPMRADLASAAPVLALTTSEYEGDTIRERIHVVDLSTGTLRPNQAVVQGLPMVFQVEPRGRYALLSYWLPPKFENLAVAAVDLGSGAQRCKEIGTVPEEWVNDLAIAADGETAWVYSYKAGRRVVLSRWSLANCRELSRLEMAGSGGAVKLRTLGTGVIAHRLVSDRLVAFDAEGHRRELPGEPRDGSMFEFALSRDGARAALATRSAVQLVDIARGELLSAPLPATLPGNDAIAQIAFSPEGTRLLARTVQGRWLSWLVPEAKQSLDELNELVGLLDPKGNELALESDATPELRRRLRAHDSPPADASEAKPAAPMALAAAPGEETAPRFVPLDLTPALNVPLRGPWPYMPAQGGDMPTLALGAQRLLGVDYRVDGAVQLSRGGPATTIHTTQPASATVPVAGLYARRVHVLTLMHIPVRRGVPSKEFARVILTGAGGRETALQIRTIRDVVTHALMERAGSTARIGFIGIGSSDVRFGGESSSYTTSAAYVVALDVPPETGAITELRLEAGDGPMEAPLFYAVTLEVDPEAQAEPRARTAP